MGLVVKGLRSALLRACDLAVAPGEVAVLRGPSGSGKTVFLRAVADLDPNEGDVRLDNAARASMSGPEWRRQVRFVAAETAWWADRVGDHFRASEAVRPYAATLGLPDGSMDWPVARLSSGEKQRLGLLRALEDKPRVLLLDEPTAALDRRAQTAVEDLIRELQAGGTIFVIVTHSDSQAERLADRSYRVDAGHIREDP